MSRHPGGRTDGRDGTGRRDARAYNARGACFRLVVDGAALQGRRGAANREDGDSDGRRWVDEDLVLLTPAFLHLPANFFRRRYRRLRPCRRHCHHYRHRRRPANFPFPFANPIPDVTSSPISREKDRARSSLEMARSRLRIFPFGAVRR